MYYLNTNNDVINKREQVLELQMNLIYIGKKHIQKNNLYFRIYGDFESDNENDNSIKRSKTTKFL